MSYNQSILDQGCQKSANSRTVSLSIKNEHFKKLVQIHVKCLLTTLNIVYFFVRLLQHLSNVTWTLILLVSRIMIYNLTINHTNQCPR